MVNEVGTRTVAKIDAVSPASVLNISHTTTSDTDILICLAAIEGNEQLEGDFCLFDGVALGPIGDTGATGDGGDVRLYAFGMMSPGANTATAKLDPQFSTSPIVAVWLNYAGVVLTSLAAATNYLDEDINTVASGATTTSVLASGGSSPNGLIVFGVAQGGTGMDGSSVDNSFIERLDDTTELTTSDFAFNLSDLLAGAPSACTITWGGSDQNTAFMLELVAAASGMVYGAHLKQGLYT